MSGIEQRRGAGFRHSAKIVLQAEIDDWAGRDAKTKPGQGFLELSHAVGDSLLEIVDGDIDELFGVIRAHYGIIGHVSLRHVLGYALSEIRVPLEGACSAGRNCDSFGFHALDGADDDILLQDFIIFECAVSSFKHVDAPQRHHGKKLLTERLEVRTVAKGSGNDCDHLAAGPQLPRGQIHETCIEIRGFNARQP